MRTIGLIGGMSWESSALYYRIINEEAKRALGGHHNAKSILYTVDFAEIEACQREGRWEDAGRLLACAARSLVAAGAEILILCTNTMHKVADAITDAAEADFIHIADAVGEEVTRASISSVALLGTRYTMEQDPYAGRLERWGLTVMVPDRFEREEVHRIIYDELCHGVAKDSSRERYRQIVDSLRKRGAEGVILGCTEIAMLLGQSDVDLPLFDTTRLHATAAVRKAL